MDPVSILSIASAAGSLAFKCGTVVQSLHGLTEKYKQAELTILSVIQDCRTIQLAWSRIERWAENSIDGYEDFEELAERLQLAIYAGQLFMEELEKDLLSIEDTPKQSTLRRRTKILWNSSVLREHQDRIQRQVCALTLLLEVIQLLSKSERVEVLFVQAPVFHNVEESVRSIVPTRLSVCSQDAMSVHSVESDDLIYIPLAFENDLFTSYVYKRNFRVTEMPIHQVHRTPEFRNAKDDMERIKTERANSFKDGGPVQHTVASSYDCVDTLESSTTLCATASATVENLGPTDTETNEALCLRDLRANPETGLNEGKIGTSLEVPATRSDPLNANAAYSIVATQAPIPGMSIGIKRKPLRSSTVTVEASNTVKLAISTEAKEECLDSFIRTFSYDQSVDVFSSIRRGDIAGASRWALTDAVDNMLHFSACDMASPDISLALKTLYNHDRPLFGSIIQVIGLMRGTRFMKNLAEALNAIENRVTDFYPDSLEHAVSQLDWANSIILDPTIANAAAFRDHASAAGILDSLPTALQLACASKKAVVVEYLLNLGQPLIPLDWTVHPFILAAKRRCRPILELFLRRARSSVSQSIFASAMAMVVSQDCSLSEDWLSIDQNDNKRIGEDVNIITLLLSNGASPDSRDRNGKSVLSMALQAAYSLNPFSLQIVDILIRKGANIGLIERDILFAGPPRLQEPFMRRHKSILQPSSPSMQRRFPLG